MLIDSERTEWLDLLTSRIAPCSIFAVWVSAVIGLQGIPSFILIIHKLMLMRHLSRPRLASFSRLCY